MGIGYELKEKKKKNLGQIGPPYQKHMKTIY